MLVCRDTFQVLLFQIRNVIWIVLASLMSLYTFCSSDSGSRLRNSVTHLLDMIEETTNQLLDGRTAQADMVDTIQVKGHDLEAVKAHCSDLEERLKEEVSRKDFLALELHKAEGRVEY